VAKVIEWTVKGFYQRGRVVLVELDEDVPDEVFAQEGNPYADWETRHDLERALQELPPKARRIAHMRLVLGMEIEEIAAELGMKRNAVDQALHRVCNRLREVYA
jgi:RNA polymerase sigma factor (sigma-70 family)